VTLLIGLTGHKNSGRNKFYGISVKVGAVPTQDIILLHVETRVWTSRARIFILKIVGLADP